MNRSIKRYALLTALLLLSYFNPIIWAQEKTAASAPAGGSGNSMLTTVLVLVIIVMIFVIWSMGQVLVTLARQVAEKQKAAKSLPVLLLAALLFCSQGTFAQDGTVATPAYYGGLESGVFWSFAIVILTELVVILSMLFFINRLQSELLPAKAHKESSLKKWWTSIDKKILTRATPIEKEADVLLDHDYDGIKELDNSLPPWWKYGFYVTIGVAVIYMFNFHVSGYGKNPTEEYIAELEEGRIKKEQYEAKNKDKIDEKNVPMADAGGLAAGKEIFNSTCFPCHGKLGEGGAGPNLTDPYWLHNGSLNDIYLSIKNGYPDKGMQSWEKNYTPKQISFLASYIKSLQGTNPPSAKAPQGEIYTEEKPAADSLKAPSPATKS